MNKAFIVSMENGGTAYKVRVPEIHKLKGTVGSTLDENLPIAPVCTIPGIIPYYKNGDIVWVDFENNDIGKPIILGQLLTVDNSNFDTSINCKTLEIKDNAYLPEDIHIGDIKPDNIKYLKNIGMIVETLNKLTEG